jgi:hypothetical protein
MRQARLDNGMVVEITEEATALKGFIVVSAEVKLGWIATAAATSAKAGTAVDVTAFYPGAVLPLQIRKAALRAAGLKPAADSIIAKLSDELQEEWEYASQVRIADPVVLAIAAVLKMTVADRQALFRRAAAF